MKKFAPSWAVTLALAPWLGIATLVALWPRGARPLAPTVAGKRVRPTDYARVEPGHGRLAASPRAIPWKGWRDILWRTWKEAGQDQLSSLAGGITFCALLAIFPALAAFVSVYGLFADTGKIGEHLRDLAAFVPRPVLELVAAQLLNLVDKADASLSFAFVTSLLLSIWSANAGMKALFNGLNVTYDETESRGWLAQTLLTLAFTAGALVFFGLSTLVLVGAPWLLERLGLGGLAGLWVPLRWLITFALAAGAFSLVYRYGPNREPARWRWVTWGAVFAAFAWIVGSLGFSWYVANLAHYDRTYGPLGAVVGFMMWLWFSANVVLLGAELNAEIEHQTALDSTTGRPEPLGARGATMADTVGASADFRPRRLWDRLRRRPPGPPVAPPGPRRLTVR